VKVEVKDFCVMMPCSVVVGYTSQHYTTQCHNPEDLILKDSLCKIFCSVAIWGLSSVSSVLSDTEVESI